MDLKTFLDNIKSLKEDAFKLLDDPYEHCDLDDIIDCARNEGEYNAYDRIYNLLKLYREESDE